jgi:hypothetical protein
MPQPIRFDVPHRLGRDEARRRMQAGLVDLDQAMSFASKVDKRWAGDRLVVEVTAFGTLTVAHLDVEDSRVSIVLALPGLLGVMGEKIAGFFKRRTTELLEDRSR